MVPPTATDQRFCCNGCAHVYDLLLSQGLDKFYDLRSGQVLSPVSPQAMRERDYTWLQEMVTDAEEAAAVAGKSATLRLAVQGLSCMGCVWLMERVFQSYEGAIRLDVNAPRGELHLEWQPGVFEVQDFARQLQQFGYLVGKPGESSGSNVQSSGFNRRVGLCGAFAMNAMAFSLPSYLGMEPGFMFASWFDLIAACSATLSLLVGGTWFAERSWQALRHGVLHIDTPITLGILAAWLGSMAGWLGGVATLKYFDFVAIFIFLMLAGRWMQQTAVERNKRRLLQSSAVPETVARENSTGGMEQIPLSAIATGDVLHVLAGQVCPVDGILSSSDASLSLEWINGESEAAQRCQGQLVPSGALNIGARAVAVRARQPWSESLLHKLTDVRESSSIMPPFFAGLLRGYLLAVVIIGIAGFIWWLMHGKDWAQALQVMISVFVVSCPCALGVAAPFADDLAATWMERLGVFVRTHGLWPKLAQVRRVIFDKTGTLTLENPVLQNPASLESLNLEARVALQHLVSSNLHPVSRSLFDAMGPQLNSEGPEVEEVIGQGVRFTRASGAMWSLGRPGWKGGVVSEAAGLMGDVVLCCDGKALAAFVFSEALRPETLNAFRTLQKRGLRLHLFSGDRTEKVAGMARMLGLSADDWHAEMTPEEKASAVATLNHKDTLYIGDGANDSLAIDAALCGGSPVTGRSFLEHKADFYFLGSSLQFVPTLLAVARLRQVAVRRVFLFAVTYNLVAILLALTGHMSPLLAAILMPLSSIVTIGIARVSFGRSLLPPAKVIGVSQETHSSPQVMHGQSMVAPVS
jgi:P-type Cu2+ transporter